jgi:hypothetical protein
MFFPEIRIGWVALLFSPSLRTLMTEGEGTAVERRRLADGPFQASVTSGLPVAAGDDLGASVGMFHAGYTKLASALILSPAKNSPEYHL